MFSAISNALDRPLKNDYKHEDQAFLAIADAPRGYHTGSSQYASADSEIKSDESIGIQRMALGPSTSTHLRNHMVRIKDEPRSVAAYAKEDERPNTPGPLQSYFEASMKLF